MRIVDKYFELECSYKNYTLYLVKNNKLKIAGYFLSLESAFSRIINYIKTLNVKYAEEVKSLFEEYKTEKESLTNLLYG